ncbi:MAG: proline--tRNA ligase [Oscillospiraceae bacterium]|nr:proline--tRNA ligase [Oscillospiraceae bacterium]MCL2278208.1 proline--tRNA ligase [Oscillospiraceae bacterium]
MGKEKNVEQITDMDVDFAQWYTDVVRKAKLIDYSGTKGFFIMRPYAYALWENIQAELDRMFKELGHENVSMPLLIPESLLQKEKDHVEGFAPEVAWVTHGGSEELPERLCIRPTSETLFCEHWANVLSSWRDLPMLYNQWCSVVRWEKTTRPFLRGREFLWQEGHTLHETAKEAEEETINMLNVYATLYEDFLAMPVVKGVKTEKEKFAGAIATYTVENMMHDKKALQGGTSHYFGDGFARAFGIQFSDRENKLTYPHQTSWGITTRTIGGIIMTHGDNNGLNLPPRIAPVQVMVIPIASHKPGVLEKADELVAKLKAAGIRVKCDKSDQSPGWKFAEHEMKGVPLRVEIGPKDIENNQCVAARRDSGEKRAIPLDELEVQVKALLEEIQVSLYNKAKKNLEQNTRPAKTLDEVKEIITEQGGFIEAMWCGGEQCEQKMKEEAGVTSRCIPFEQKNIGDRCAACGEKAEKMVVWGVAY